MQEEPINLEDIKFSAIMSIRQTKREENLALKQKAQKLTRQIPIQLLAREWFNQIDSSTEMRAYLIENFLPILVLGCERVLNEAQSRDLVHQNRRHADFNPINCLAQFLMRNNPKYNNSNESSPYVKTMRELYDDLREQIFFLQGNKIAKVKEEVRRRRIERKNEENYKKIEAQRRKSHIERLFGRFYLDDQNGRLELKILNEMLKIFNYKIETLNNQNNSLQIKLNPALLPNYCLNKNSINFQRRLLRHEFVECVSLLSDHLKSDMFDFFLELLDECGVLVLSLAKASNLDKITRELVKIMDTTKSGYLIRKRVIQILKQFLERNKKLNLNEPFEWPVLDPIVKFENRSDKSSSSSISAKSVVEEVEQQNPEAKLSSPKTLLSPKEPPTQEPLVAENTETIQSVVNKEATASQELAAGNQDTNEEDRKNSLNDDPEVQKKDSYKKFSIDVPLNSIDKQLENERKAMRETELLFLKGGSLYYNPLKEPLNAFDSGLFAEKSILPSNYSNNVDLDEPQFAFDSKFINAKQFANLVRNFLSKNLLDSEIYINELITFLRENYNETSNEKTQKLKQLNSIKQSEIKEKKYDECFEKLDNEGSNRLELNYLINCLNNFKSGLFKDQISKVKNESFNTNETVFLSRKEFFNFMSDLVQNLSPNDSLSPYQEQFISYLNGFAKTELRDKSRSESRKSWLKQIKYVGDVCLGSFNPLFKQLFLTLLKDAENYGGNKILSAYVGILEKASPISNQNRSEVVLRYHASTPNDSRIILGKILTRSGRNVSFDVIDRGASVHVERVRDNSAVFFFNPENKNDGSLAVYPLKFPRNNVFGVIGIDTLQQTRPQQANQKDVSYFSDYELQFYQGVSSVFSEAYINLIFKNRFIKCCRSAVEWLYKTSNKQIEGINLYFVQRLDSSIRIDVDPTDSSAYPPQTSEGNLNIKQVVRYEFDDSLKSNDQEKNTFQNVDYYLGSKLYECAVLSETTMSYFNGKLSSFVPLRDQNQKTVLVMEIVQKEKRQNIDEENEDIEQANLNQSSLVETVLHVLYKCQQSLINEHFLGASSQNQFEYEIVFEEEKFAILFEKCFIEFALSNLSKHVNLKLEIPDHMDKVLTNFLNVISDLIVVEADEEQIGQEFREQQIINEAVINRLRSLDPTKQENEDAIFEKINRYNISVQGLTDFYRENFVIDPLKSLLEWFLLILDMKSRKESLKANLE